MILRHRTALVKRIRRALVENGPGAHRGPSSLRSPLRRRRAGFFPQIARYLARMARTCIEDLFLYLYYPPHGPHLGKWTQKRQITAAMVTRGAGIDAAVIPAGEGRREWRGGLVGDGRYSDQPDEKEPRGSGQPFRRFISPLGERKPIWSRHWRRQARLKRALLQILRIRKIERKMMLQSENCRCFWRCVVILLDLLWRACRDARFSRLRCFSDTFAVHL